MNPRAVTISMTTDNHKHNKNKKKRLSSDHEPKFLSMPLKASKKKKKSSSSSLLLSDSGAPSAYNEDLGTTGIKTKTVASSSSNSQFRLPVTTDEKDKRLKRMARFGIKTKDQKEPDALSCGLSAPRSSEALYKATKKELSNPKKTSKRLVGTCNDLEKPYLRLTTFPEPSKVRPLQVLVKSLAHIKNRFVQTEDFDWANEQLKSVRQDITVQRLRNKFVLEVYETHARILLEHGDLNEFNQCQTMIRTLTTGNKSNNNQDTKSSNSDDYGNGMDQMNDDDNDNDNVILTQCEEAADEIRGYGLLYALVQNSWGELTKGLSDASEAELGSRGGNFHRDTSFRHAVKVVKAVIHNDYQTFFRLYESPPHLSAYLMDFLVKRVRDAAYKRIIAAYRPTVSVEHIREALYLQDLEETRRFLRKNGAVFVQESGEPPFWVDCKASVK